LPREGLLHELLVQLVEGGFQMGGLGFVEEQRLVLQVGLFVHFYHEGLVRTGGVGGYGVGIGLIDAYMVTFVDEEAGDVGKGVVVGLGPIVFHRVCLKPVFFKVTQQS
jgi:hypothetical protein